MNSAVKNIELVENKICKDCNFTKSLSEFSDAAHGGKRRECRECEGIKKAKYRKNNLVKYALYSKRQRLRANGVEANAEKIEYITKLLKSEPDKRMNRPKLTTIDHRKKYVKKYNVEYNKKNLKLKSLHRYGLTLNDLETMWKNQMGLCANRACGKEILIHGANGKRATAHVDHNHTTGKVRGLLCQRCNIALGHLEKKNLVFGLTEYLNKFDG